MVWELQWSFWLIQSSPMIFFRSQSFRVWLSFRSRNRAMDSAIGALQIRSQMWNVQLEWERPQAGSLPVRDLRKVRESHLFTIQPTCLVQLALAGFNNKFFFTQSPWCSFLVMQLVPTLQDVQLYTYEGIPGNIECRWVSTILASQAHLNVSAALHGASDQSWWTGGVHHDDFWHGMITCLGPQRRFYFMISTTSM